LGNCEEGTRLRALLFSAAAEVAMDTPHPYHDQKSAQATENKGVTGEPLRKRVRNCMKILCLQGYDKEQRT
jgi:hypothetical protein